MVVSYDNIIIGTGIAGLTAAYKLKRAHPNESIVLFEKSHRVEGGRIKTFCFGRRTVPGGAGIGRQSKDRLLLELLDELGISYSAFPIKHQFPAATPSPGAHQLKRWYETLVRHADSARASETFKEFGMRVLGKEAYDQFRYATGYTDFERADPIVTINNWGFDDVLPLTSVTPNGVSINWKMLLRALVKAIGRHNIRTNKEVKRINTKTKSVWTSTGELSTASKRLIIATEAIHAKRLLPKHKLLTYIKSQPFIRIYAKVRTSSSKDPSLPKAYTVLPPSNPLSKVIPMDPKHGIYMIGYADNRNAMVLRNATKKQLEEWLSVGLGASTRIRLQSIKMVFWKHGTHFFTPLPVKYRNDLYAFGKKLWQPAPGVYLVGEAFSLHQGWCEGALETVENMLKS